MNAKKAAELTHAAKKNCYKRILLTIAEAARSRESSITVYRVLDFYTRGVLSNLGYKVRINYWHDKTTIYW